MRLRIVALIGLVAALATAGAAQTADSLLVETSTTAMLYDDYFHQGEMALQRVTNIYTGEETYVLRVTMEEGNTNVAADDRLMLHLRRNGGTITLRSQHALGSDDVSYRRFPDHRLRFITCYYPIDLAALAQIFEHDVNQVIVECNQGLLKRNTRSVASRLIPLLRELQ